MCPNCYDKLKSCCVECQCRKYIKDIQNINRSDREKIERIRNGPILRGIKYATRFDKTRNFYGLEDIEEAFSFELASKLLSKILYGNLSDEDIFKHAKSLTFVRKRSWFKFYVRQKNTFALKANDYILTYDGEGFIYDFGFSNHQSILPNRCPNICTNLPEQIFLDKELYLIIHQYLPNWIKSLKMKRTKEYELILRLMLEGIDVMPLHGAMLGIDPDKVVDYKHQLRKLILQFFLQFYPEFVDDLPLKKSQRKKMKSLEFISGDSHAGKAI